MVIEQRPTPPLRKQETSMRLLFPAVWSQKGTIVFANSQQRGVWVSEKLLKGFNSFTNLGLTFSSHSSDVWMTLFWFVKWGLLFFRNEGDSRRQGPSAQWAAMVPTTANTQWESPVLQPSSGQPCRSPCQPWGGPPTEEDQVHAGSGLFLTLMQRSKRIDLDWGNILRHCSRFSNQ